MALKSTNISAIARMKTGIVSGSESQNRRFMSRYSGSGASSRVISFGSSAIPQIGQVPGPIWTISGCIGQVNSILDFGSWILDSRSAGGISLGTTESARGDKNESGSAANLSLHRTAQK